MEPTGQVQTQNQNSIWGSLSLLPIWERFKGTYETNCTLPAFIKTITLSVLEDGALLLCLGGRAMFETLWESAVSCFKLALIIRNTVVPLLTHGLASHGFRLLMGRSPGPKNIRQKTPGRKESCFKLCTVPSSEIKSVLFPLSVWTGKHPEYPLLHFNGNLLHQRRHTASCTYSLPLEF